MGQMARYRDAYDCKIRQCEIIAQVLTVILWAAQIVCHALLWIIAAYSMYNVSLVTRNDVKILLRWIMLQTF